MLAFSIQLLTSIKHRDKLLDPSSASFWLLRIVNAVKDSVAVGTIQTVKELSCLRVLIQLFLEILGHCHVTLGSIGPLPTPIFLRPLNLPQTSGLHSALLNPFGHPFMIIFRPLALCAARRKPLQPIVIVKSCLLTVAPTIAERHIYRFKIGYGSDARCLFSQLQPEARGAIMVFRQPLLPRWLRFKGNDWQAILGVHNTLLYTIHARLAYIQPMLYTWNL